MVIVLSDDSVKGNDALQDQVVKKIRDVLNLCGVVIQPQLNQSEQDRKYLYTNNITGAWVDKLREEVEGLPGVEAAYLKPMDELP